MIAIAYMYIKESGIIQAGNLHMGLNLCGKRGQIN